MNKQSIRVASVQFEMVQRDKDANLATMFGFIDAAAAQGADIISFQEFCTTGYNFMTESDRETLLALAEDTHAGPTVARVRQKAAAKNIVVMFGMLEKTPDEKMYNTYVVVTPAEGNVFQHRKIHAFENSAISQGDRLDVFELFGWTMGALICYDNNLPENPRILCLKGAEIIFAPHQTGGFDIDSAGMGKIDLDLWRNRKSNPTAIRNEFDGPKGKAWLMKWLPCRAYDNNVFYVFNNGVGIDEPEVRTGGCLIVDPEGIVLEETWALGNDMIVADLDKSARVNTIAGGHIAARRPSLYGKIVEAIEEVDTRTVRNKLSGHTIK